MTKDAKTSYIVRIRVPGEGEHDIALCATAAEAKAMAWGAWLCSDDSIGSRAIVKASTGHENTLLSFGIGQVSPEEHEYALKHQAGAI